MKENHYYTVHLVTGSNQQLPRDSLSADPCTEVKASLKHDDTDNGIMSFPTGFDTIKRSCLKLMEHTQEVTSNSH
jgi:hypothetical protein